MESDDLLKGEWNRASRSWIDFVRDGKDYYREYMNGPALKRMVGDVRGKRVLDLGCGEGYYSRVFASAGALVTGVDFSEAMIDAALEEERRELLGINYILSDAAELKELPSNSFDVAFAFMALMDIEDYESAISEASRVLKEEGRFIIIIPHPCFGLRAKNGETVGDWKTKVLEDGSVEYLYYYIKHYFHRHVETVRWDFDRLASHFITTSYHHTLSDYVNTLNKYGLAVTGMDEPKPTEEGTRVHPTLKRHYRVPHSLAIEARKMSR